ncbi:Ide [Symbiodinium sp. CCMP2592]|nr:Ide [Symbiodinium sp. CCMP2592]
MFFRETRDVFFYQWLLLYKAHRSAQELLPTEALKVEQARRHQAAAVLLMPECWANDVWIEKHLARNGHRADYITTRLAQLRAERHARLPTLNREQQRVLEVVLQYTEQRQDALEHNPTARHFCLTGGPGTGKTVVVDHLVEDSSARGWNVLLLCPTGKLACRKVHQEGVTSITLQRLVAMENVTSMANFASQHVVWILCETGMVTRNQWEQLYYVWKACECSPTLLAEGDFQQLPPPVQDAAADARHSASLHWERAFRLTVQHRCKDADSEFRVFQDEIRAQQPARERIEEVLGGCHWSQDVDGASVTAARKHLPEALVLCSTRAMQAAINAAAIEAEEPHFVVSSKNWLTISREA